MNWRIVFHLFASANILIICFIAKEEATDNSETELIEESDLKTKIKGKQPQYEEAPSSSSVPHQRHTEGCSAETSEIEEIREEGPSYSGGVTYSDRKTFAVADVEDATRITTDLFSYSKMMHAKKKQEEKLRLCEHFIENRHTNPQELFVKYSRREKLKLCLRIWLILFLGKDDKKKLKPDKGERRVKNIKDGPVFQKTVKCGDGKIVPNVTVIGCRVVLGSSKPYSVFITPSILPGSYYIMYYYGPEEVNEIELFNLAEDVSLEENSCSMVGKILSRICQCQKTKND